MEFCQKCGGMIVIEGGKALCASCGYKPGKKPRVKSSEKIKRTESVVVVKNEDNVYPTVEMKCSKCKHNKCYFWTQQTRASDESETKFYKCVKCKHTWRVYR